MPNKSVRNPSVLTCFFVFIALSAIAIPCRSAEDSSPPSLNDHRLKNQDGDFSDYSFWIAGHIYGSHNASLYPAASLLANKSIFNRYDASFAILTGDIVQSPTPKRIELLQESFLDHMNFPVFNAAGNHDLMDRDAYESFAGRTYFSFMKKPAIFLILDTELDDGDISGLQRDFFEKTLEKFESSEELKTLFIFSHRLIWAIDHRPYNRITRFTNWPAKHKVVSRYVRDNTMPRIKSLKNKRVYWISGDVGTAWSFSIFFQNDERHNVSFAAVGLGDTGHDAVLLARVGSSGQVELTPFSLTGEPLAAIDQYNIDFWENRFNGSKAEKGSVKETLKRAARFLIRCFFKLLQPSFSV